MYNIKSNDVQSILHNYIRIALLYNTHNNIIILLVNNGIDKNMVIINDEFDN